MRRDPHPGRYTRWREETAGTKNSPILPSPVTAALSRPTDTGGSSAEATPQNSDVTGTNTSDGTIHRSRSGERVRAATLLHHVQPAVTQNSTAAGGSRKGGAHCAMSLLPGLLADLDQVHPHLDRDHHPHQDPQAP